MSKKHDKYEEIGNNSDNLIITTFQSLSEKDFLFDFSSLITEDVFVANGIAQVYRKKNEDLRFRRINVVGKREAMNGSMPGFDYQMLLNITSRSVREGLEYELAPSLSPKTENLDQLDILKNSTFIFLSNMGKANEVASYRIGKDDVIRLGKTFFKVVDTHLSKNQSSKISKAFSQNASIPLAINSSRACRICLTEGGNDLISPCSCRGSCECIHFSCLQAWIQSKVRKEENSMVAVYSLAKLECEICKKSLPNRMEIDGVIQSLVEFEWPDEPFIVLEKLPLQGQPGRTFYVLTPKEKEVRIGRWPDQDLRVQDSTMSRKHASISFTEGSFWLKDEESRFGSMVLLQRKVPVGRWLCLQAGCKLLKLQPQRQRYSALRMRA